MAAIVSYFWPKEPVIDEKTIETTTRTITIPLGDRTNPLAAQSLYTALESRLDKWQQLQPWRYANLLRVHGYRPTPGSLQSVDVVTDEWPTVLQYIQDKNPDVDKKLKFCLDLARGVLNLHNNNLPHGAIRGDNVYIRGDGVCVLGQPAPFNYPTAEDLKTYERWFSPEIRNPATYRLLRVDHHHHYQGEYMLPNDIHMLASTFAEIFTGTTPIPQPLPNNSKSMAVVPPVLFDSKDNVDLEMIPSDLRTLLKQMRILVPVFRFNANKTVDAMLSPILSRQRSSNYINSKGIARGVFANTVADKRL